ncbi:MAG: tetratricopeptide repeat protein [Pelosinus sp.]|nr:tetratricopeptide repeat protein [Pelosinus sp.]
MVRVVILLCLVFNLMLCVPTACAQVVENSEYGISLIIPDAWKVSYGGGPGHETLLFRAFDNEKYGRIVFSAMPPFPLALGNSEYDQLLEMYINAFYSKRSDVKVLSVKKDTIANQDANIATFSYPRKDGGREVMLKAAFWINDTILDVSAIAKEENSEQEMQAFLDILKSIKLNKLTGREWSKQGYSYKANRNYEKTRESFSNAIRLQTKNFDNYYELAYANAEMGDYSQAVSAMSKAIELKPNAAFYYHERGFSYIKIKNAKSALSDENQAIKLDSSQAIFYAGRGNAYVLMAKYPEAIEDFKKCLELKGDPLDSQFNLGQVYDFMGNQDKALYYYTIISKMPNLPDEVKSKVDARIKGDWSSYKEWL